MIGRLIRLKKNYPFSESLNRYIEQKFAELSANIKVEFTEDEPYFVTDDLDLNAQKMFEDFTQNRLKIWTGASENTIFGLPEINHKFRFIHDYYHCQNRLGFSAGDELLVNYIQQQVFRKDGLNQFDCDLLNIETAGQILYYTLNQDFPVDQRSFTITELAKLGY